MPISTLTIATQGFVGLPSSLFSLGVALQGFVVVPDAGPGPGPGPGPGGEVPSPGSNRFEVMVGGGGRLGGFELGGPDGLLGEEAADEASSPCSPEEDAPLDAALALAEELSDVRHKGVVFGLASLFRRRRPPRTE